LCPEEYALVGIGALIGALVDKAITREVTVYENPAADSAEGNVALTPLLRRRSSRLGPRRVRHDPGHLADWTGAPSGTPSVGSQNVGTLS
jgi:hypothetical protein